MTLSRSRICSDFSSSEFLFAISHELKNPLNAIIGFSDVLRSEMNNLEESNSPKVSFAECIDCAHEINQAAYEMTDLIHDLLDVGSSTSGSFSADLDKKINIENAIKRSVKLNYNYDLRRSVSLNTERDLA